MSKDAMNAGQLDFQAAVRFQVRRRGVWLYNSSVSRTHFNESFQLSQLMYSDSGSNITQIVFKSAGSNFVIPIPVFGVTVPRIFADAVEAKNFHPVVKILPVSNGHAALTRSDIFRGVEAKTDCIALLSGSGETSADLIAFIVCADGMCCILDNLNFFSAANCQMAVISHGNPPRCTGIIARVLPVRSLRY